MAAYVQYLTFDGTALPFPDSYEVDMILSSAVAELSDILLRKSRDAEADTSYKGLWEVSFTLKEF